MAFNFASILLYLLEGVGSSLMDETVKGLLLSLEDKSTRLDSKIDRLLDSPYKHGIQNLKNAYRSLEENELNHALSYLDHAEDNFALASNQLIGLEKLQALCFAGLSAWALRKKGGSKGYFDQALSQDLCQEVSYELTQIKYGNMGVASTCGGIAGTAAGIYVGGIFGAIAGIPAQMMISAIFPPLAFVPVVSLGVGLAANYGITGFAWGSGIASGVSQLTHQQAFSINDIPGFGCSYDELQLAIWEYSSKNQEPNKLKFLLPSYLLAEKSK